MRLVEDDDLARRSVLEDMVDVVRPPVYCNL